jgi:hypothetical protein
LEQKEMKQQPSKKDILGWTQLLEVAARTERRLPKAIKKQKLTSWVDYKTNPHESYGYENKMVKSFIPFNRNSRKK